MRFGNVESPPIDELRFQKTLHAAMLLSILPLTLALFAARGERDTVVVCLTFPARSKFVPSPGLRGRVRVRGKCREHNLHPCHLPSRFIVSISRIALSRLTLAADDLADGRGRRIVGVAELAIRIAVDFLQHHVDGDRASQLLDHRLLLVVGPIMNVPASRNHRRAVLTVHGPQLDGIGDVPDGAPG